MTTTDRTDRTARRPADDPSHDPSHDRELTTRRRPPVLAAVTPPVNAVVLVRRARGYRAARAVARRHRSAR